MKRLLCLISAMNAGGAETFLMKIYRALDKTKYQMDFCVNETQKGFYEDEILQSGGKFYRIPSKTQDFKTFNKRLSEIVKSNQYDYVLRISSSSVGFLDMKIAKKAGAKICAVRSSNSSDGNSLAGKIIHRTCRFLFGKFVDVAIAPSDLAATYTFGEKAYKNGNVAILHNGLDLNTYRFNEKERKKIRTEFSIPEDAFVVGHVGRFSQQKNHSFLIDAFNEIQKENQSSVLLLIGKGELEQEIKEKITSYGIEDKVIFGGVRSDVPALLSAMDLFIMPSFYEGMPNTIIEAQATGLPSLLSDTITKEANITGLVEYLPLSAGSREWCEKALSLRGKSRNDPAIHEAFEKEGYTIESVTKRFVSLIFGETI